MGNPLVERRLVRALVALALSSALLACALVPAPHNPKGDLDLPAFAFEQVGLYRLEIALLVFYGGLLLITPAFSGLVWGRLPTEISAPGAKFAEGVDQAAERNEAAIKELERGTNELTEGLKAANFKIELLQESSSRDNTQPAVDSKP
jgi:hypothetical protein